MADELKFPDLPSGKNIDSQQFGRSRADPGIGQETDGGYTVTRPRFTRKPPRTFNIAFVRITDEDRQVIEDFWDETLGSSRAFKWLNIQDEKEYLVRFKLGQELSFRFSGIGKTQFWDCSLVLVEI